MDQERTKMAVNITSPVIWIQRFGICRNLLMAVIRHPAEFRHLPGVLSYYLTRGHARDQPERGPFMSYSVIRWLASFLNSEKVVFEYGSGHSTLYFAKRAKFVFSVEHSPEWYNKISDAITHLNLNNCRLTLLEPEPNNHITSNDPSDPKAYLSSKVTQGRLEQYVREIDKLADGSIDLVVVDGRARPSSILHALDKVKPGGVLLLDDADRQHYQRSIHLLDTWERMDISGLTYTGAFVFASAWIKSGVKAV